MKVNRMILCLFLLLFTFCLLSPEKKISAASGDNLLVNGNAEDGLTGWTDPTGNGKWMDSPYAEWNGAYVYPYEGGHFFYSDAESDFASIYQLVDISTYPTGELFVLSGWLANWDQAPNDQSTLQLEFLNSNGTILDSYIRQQRNPNWAYHSITVNKPEGAITIRVTLIANRYVGTDNDAYFDDIRLCASSEEINRVYVFCATSTAKAGDSIQLTASNGSSTSASDFEWSSSYDTIATVDTNGLATFQKNDLGEDKQQVSIYAMDKKTGVVGAFHFNMDVMNESEGLEFIEGSDEDIDNLLINGNAENGVTAWTDSTGDGKWEALEYEEYRGDYVYPYEGKHFFYSAAQSSSASIYQDVDISGYKTGTTFVLSGWLANWDQSPNDQSTLRFDFLDSKGKILETRIAQQRNPIWNYHSIMAYKPAKATVIRVILDATRYVGTDNDAYFDDIRLVALEEKQNKVYVSASKTTAKAGKTLQLTANNGTITKASNFIWSSSYDAIATVNEKGLVTIIQSDSPVIIYAQDKTTNIIGCIHINSSQKNETPAPTKVTGIKVSKKTSNSVTLTWKKNTNATGYRIYQYNAKTKKYVLVKTIKKGTTNKVTISKLSSGKTYNFKIKAYKTYGSKTYDSGLSNVIKVKTK